MRYRGGTSLIGKKLLPDKRIYTVYTTCPELLAILQVVYVTATVPFVFLGIMFVRGVTLDGAAEGMMAFISPDFEKLLSFQVTFNCKNNLISIR